jgi:hypothetical protein
MGTRRSSAHRRPSVAFTLSAFCLFLTWLTVGVGCSADGRDEDAVSSAEAVSKLPEAKTAADALRHAADEVNTFDTRLADEMSTVGPALTDDEKRAYVRAYHALPDVKAAETAYLRAALTLDAILQRIVGSPTALARVMKGISSDAGTSFFTHVVYGPSDFYDGYRLLAASPIAAGALRFTGRLLRHDAAFGAIHKSDDDVVKDLLVVALPHAAAQELLATRDDDAAVGRLKSALSGVRLAGPVFAAIEGLRRTGNGALFLHDVDCIDKRLAPAVLATASALMIWQSADRKSRPSRDRARLALLAIARGGKQTVAALGQATSIYRTFVRLWSEEGWHLRIAEAAARIGSGIAVVLQVTSLAYDLSEWSRGTPEKLRVLRDVISIAAGIATFFELGPAAVVLGVLTLAISLIADWIEASEEAARKRADERSCLTKVGLPPELVETLSLANSSRMRDLHERFHFAPADIKWLGLTSPQVLKWDGLFVDGLARLVQACRYTARVTVDLLHFVASTAQDDERAYIVGLFIHKLAWMWPKDKAGWEAALEQQIAMNQPSLGAYQDDYKRACRGAVGFLEAH